MRASGLPANPTVVVSPTRYGPLITALKPDWLEDIGLDPNGGNGTVEWLIVAALGVAAVASAVQCSPPRLTRHAPPPRLSSGPRGTWECR